MTITLHEGHAVDMLARLYLDEGLSATQIAAREGLAVVTVWRRLRRHGVPIRSRSERAKRAHRPDQRRRAVTKPLKGTLRCRMCSWVWRRQGEHTTEPCPRCGQIVSCRDRKHEQRVNDGFANAIARSRGRSPESRAAGRARYRRSVLLLVGKGTVACARCGCDRPELLEVNHIHGGGAAEMRRCGGSRRFYQAIVRLERPTDDLELTCKVCNALHYLEMKYGPLPFSVTYAKQETDS